MREPLENPKSPQKKKERKKSPADAAQQMAHSDQVFLFSWLREGARRASLHQRPRTAYSCALRSTAGSRSVRTAGLHSPGCETRGAV
jgi:hypothetical protein